VTNLFPDYLKGIVHPRSALCQLILEVGSDLDDVAHNITVGVGYDVFLCVNHTPNS
jgi:hypothetical protein